MGMLIGCSSENELEERCFPMLAAVGWEKEEVLFELKFPYAKEGQSVNDSNQESGAMSTSGTDFAEAKRRYEERINKRADYNHMKVFVMETAFFQEEEACAKMLQYLQTEEEIPRNAYVCLVDRMEELENLESGLSQDPGTYLEEYLKLHEKKKTHLLTLGDLMDAWKNDDTVLYLPYLKPEKNYVEWRGYMNKNGEIWKESK